jgi:hypothetical protein
MTPSELISDLVGKAATPQELLFARLLLWEIAEHLHYATLPNGEFLHGPTDHAKYLKACGDELREMRKKLCAPVEEKARECA